MKTFDEIMEIQGYTDKNRKLFKLCSFYWFASFACGIVSTVVVSMTLWGFGLGLFIVGSAGFISVYFNERKHRKEAAA